ncbi:MAG: glucose 1-dehydrogenase [Rhodospirillales bacterium]|jgi:2-deoxy-D-gluconate 3-dehydrogenase
MRLFDLSGSVALITGGNGGIGLAFGKAMAEAGARVMVAGRNTKKNAAAVEQIQSLGAEADSIEVDITDPEACRRMVQETVKRFNSLNILVNNAGTAVRKQPQDISLEEFRLVMETNLTSAFVTSQAAYPEMLKVGGGKIINIGSMMSLFGAAFSSPYASSKGGIVQLTKSLACAWAKDNIQCNAVLPGWIDTELTQQARQQVPGLHERVLSRSPTGRWGVPDDHAGTAVFLASRASDFVTGASIPVDGGYSVFI